MIELSLPIPVSLNHLYKNNNGKGGKGRSKTKRAKEWTRDCQEHVFETVKKHKALCNENFDLRNKHWSFKAQTYKLSPLHKERPNLSYEVEYSYAFAQPRAVKPTDIANFEKLLSDLLVDVGLLLDDSFIDDMRMKRLPPDKNNPRVLIKIKTLDLIPYLY